MLTCTYINVTPGVQPVGPSAPQVSQSRVFRINDEVNKVRERTCGPKET